MPSRRTLTLLIGALIALALPAIALAASGRPHAGKWKTTSGGGFMVSADQKTVSGFHISGTSCGLKNVTVTGKQQLRLIDGTNWGVGFSDPTRKNPNDVSGVVPQKVTIHASGKTLTGRLDIIFAVGGYTRDNSGDLKVNDCYISFFARAEFAP